MDKLTLLSNANLDSNITHYPPEKSQVHIHVDFISNCFGNVDALSLTETEYKNLTLSYYPTENLCVDSPNTKTIPLFDECLYWKPQIKNEYQHSKSQAEIHIINKICQETELLVNPRKTTDRSDVHQKTHEKPDQNDYINDVDDVDTIIKHTSRERMAKRRLISHSEETNLGDITEFNSLKSQTNKKKKMKQGHKNVQHRKSTTNGNKKRDSTSGSRNVKAPAKYYDSNSKTSRLPLFWTLKWTRNIHLDKNKKIKCHCRNRNSKQLKCINPWHYDYN